MSLVVMACGGSADVESGSSALTTPRTEAPGTSAAAQQDAATTSRVPVSTSAGPTATDAAPSTTGASPHNTVVDAGGPCGWTPVHSGPTLTFVAGGELSELDAEGKLHCLAPVSGPTSSLSWAPTGQRALIDGGLVLEAERTTATGATGAATGGWTWPTGLRFVQAEGGRLSKVESDGSGVIDISFLDQHGAATYHPDGLHLAVAGTGTALVEWWNDDESRLEVEEWTQTGLFLVRNDGTGEQVWIDAQDAEITEVVFSADGTRLSFVADHHDSRHVHSFDLPEMIFETGDGERILTALPEDPGLIEPQFESITSLSHLTIDPHDSDRVLFAEGDCASGVGVELLDLEAGGYPTPVASDLHAIPVGFLGPDRVAVLELDQRCTGTGALWVVDLTTNERTLVADSVDAAAVRWQAPDLLMTLQDIVIAGFA